MALDAKKVYIGTAEQDSTTGAVLTGPVITTIPANITDALTAIASFDSSGYVSNDGVTLTTELSTNDLQEWNGATVRKLMESFTGTITLNIIQADYEGWCQAIGAENVTRIAATTTHGEQLHIKLGAHMAQPKAWALKMKDGDFRMLVLVPNGQVVSNIEMTFASSDAIALPLEISCNDDGTGESIHIYTDDGILGA